MELLQDGNNKLKHKSMGLFDFGDRATIQTLAYRIGVGVEQMESEIRVSPNAATPMLRGLAHAVCDERKKLMLVATSLSQSSLDSLIVEFRKRKIPFNVFLQELTHISIKVNELTKIVILDY